MHDIISINKKINLRSLMTDKVSEYANVRPRKHKSVMILDHKEKSNIAEMAETKMKMR